jgi:nicotinamidase-related amidase
MAKTALLVLDVQNRVVEWFPGPAEPMLTALARAASAARTAGIPVIYVTVAFRPGWPEVSPRNRTFASLAASGTLGAADPGTGIHPAVAPGPDDIVVTKKRVSAFAGSDLQLVLRSLGVESLVLGGVATSGVVLSTLRQASDLDYEITVLRDGCADGDDEVHRVLLDKVFPRQAEVVATDEWVAALAGPDPRGTTGG